MEGCFVYKYVCGNEVVYVGKADSGLERRIREHGRERRFIDLPDPRIYWAPLCNPAETAAMELLLICKYKPRLNIRDKYPEALSIGFKEPEWKRYHEYLPAGSWQPPRLKDCAQRGVQEQEAAFWEAVLTWMGADGKKEVFRIEKSRIPDVSPLWLTYGGIPYKIFICSFPSGREETFILSEEGKGFAESFLRMKRGGRRNEGNQAT